VPPMSVIAISLFIKGKTHHRLLLVAFSVFLYDPSFVIMRFRNKFLVYHC